MPDPAPVREQVDLVELAEEKFGRGVYQGTFLQQAGVKLFNRVLMVTIIVIGFIVVYWLVETVRIPAWPLEASQHPGVTDSLAARVISEHRATAFSNFETAIQMIVIGVFFPLLTAILGYLFGTGETGQAPDNP